MATLTLDNDLMDAHRAGLIDLNTAEALHKGRRQGDRLRKSIKKRQDEIDVLNVDAAKLVAAEFAALNPTAEAATE